MFLALKEEKNQGDNENIFFICPYENKYVPR